MRLYLNINKGTYSLVDITVKRLWVKPVMTVRNKICVISRISIFSTIYFILFYFKNITFHC